MLAPSQRAGGAEHGKPQKTGGNELVGPFQRVVEHEAGDHAGEIHHHLRHHQGRRGRIDQRYPFRMSSPKAFFRRST